MLLAAAVKTGYAREHDRSLRRPPQERERELAGQARDRLHGMLAASLGIAPDEVEHFIADRLAEDW